MTRRGSRRRIGVAGALAIVMLLGGLGAGGYWLWDNFGTNGPALAQAANDLAEFDRRSIVTTDEASEPAADADALIAPLSAIHTDFEAAPVPTIDMDSLRTGDVLGTLIVPTWNGKQGVYGEWLTNRIPIKQGGTTEAATTRVLNTAAASHYRDTQGPGEIGNFALSGHRRTHGNNFLRVPDLRAGDFLLVQTSEHWLIYRVTDHEVISPRRTTVLDPNPFEPGAEPTRRVITLTTCTKLNGSPWGNSHRWITRGELFGWSARSDGVPPMIDAAWQG